MVFKRSGVRFPSSPPEISPQEILRFLISQEIRHAKRQSKPSANYGRGFAYFFLSIACRLLCHHIKNHIVSLYHARIADRAQVADSIFYRSSDNAIAHRSRQALFS